MRLGSDQLAPWRCAWDSLADGGRFVVDVTMPSLAAYADSMQTPPRTSVEIDIDARDPITGTRLLRYKTTRYLPHEQRAEIRFLYDKFPDSCPVDRYVSDFDCHVYPRELELSRDPASRQARSLLSLAVRCSEYVSRRGQLRAARISGKWAVRICGTRTAYAASRLRRDQNSASWNQLQGRRRQLNGLRELPRLSCA